MTTTLTCRPAHDYPEFVGAWPRLTGRQEPEFESRWPGDESEGDRCATFGANIGMRCMPWEWHTLQGVLSLQPPNEYGERLWTHRDGCIECTRQQGKTLLIVLLILFHLFVKPCAGRVSTRKIVYTAQQWSTVSDVFDRVEAVIVRRSSLRKQLAKNPSKRDNHGVIELKNGAKAEFGPRSKHFARGYTEVDLLIFDESYDIDPGHESNLTGSQSAATNPQTLYMSTPPVFAEHPNSHALAGMHRLGHAGAPDLFYRLFAAPRHASRDDPQAWAMAQPSYGVATNEREIRSKRQKAKSTPQRQLFDADYMGWGDYPPPESTVNSAIDAQKWEDMGPKNGPPRLTNSPAIGIHRTGGVWSVTGAQYTDTGQAHLEIGYSRTVSSAEVVRAVVELVTAWDPVAVAIKGRSEAAAIEAELIKAGVEPVMVHGGKWSQYCGGFLNAAMASGLSHSDQADLNDAAASAVRHDMPSGGFVWDELAAGAAAPALCSATLAYGALLEFGNAKKRKPAGPVSEKSAVMGRESHSVSDELDVFAAF